MTTRNGAVFGLALALISRASCYRSARNNFLRVDRSYAVLVNLVYEYYPRGVETVEPLYGKSDEIQRLRAVAKSSPVSAQASALLATLQGSLQGCEVHDMTFGNDDNPSHHLRIMQGESIFSPGAEVSVLVSQVVPMYYIYTSPDVYGGAVDTYLQAAILSAMKEHLPSYVPLSAEDAGKVVPDIEKNLLVFGEVTILSALFTDHLY